MNVEQLMTKDPRYCTPSSRLNDAAHIMWEADCGFVPVVRENGSAVVVGVITDRDVCMAAYTRGRGLKEIQVQDVMAREVRCCHPNDPLSRAEALMREAQVRRLPVVDQGQQLVGVISLSDLAREAAREQGSKRRTVRDEEVGATLAVISRPRQLAG